MNKTTNPLYESGHSKQIKYRREINNGYNWRAQIPSATFLGDNVAWEKFISS
jgi:hypothetical protein